MSGPPERSVCATCGRVYLQGERFCSFDRTDLSPEQVSVVVDPLLGSVLGGSYTLRDRLSAGGMGVVYRAWQNRLERNVAIKVLSPSLGGDSGAVDRFRTEALAVSQLTNPHTVAVYDFGTTGEGLLYLVMKLVPGDSLRIRIAAGLTIREAVSIAGQMCESLGEAHDRTPQIVHRDVKPDNIIVNRTPEGEEFVTVLDFGLAKLANAERLTVAGRIVGTPKYMAPEQAQDEKDITHRVDLYSVGVILHEMVTGKAPFEAPNAAGYLYKHVCEMPPVLTTVRPDLDIPPELERLVLELLSKDPKDRPASAQVVRARLLEITRRLPDSSDESEPRTDRVSTEDETADSVPPVTPSTPTMLGMPPSDDGPALTVAPAHALKPVELAAQSTPRRSRRGVISIATAVLVIGAIVLGFALKSAQQSAATPAPLVAARAPPPLPKPEPVPEPPQQPVVVAVTEQDKRLMDETIDQAEDEVGRVEARLETALIHTAKRKSGKERSAESSTTQSPAQEPSRMEDRGGFIVVPR